MFRALLTVVTMLLGFTLQIDALGAPILQSVYLQNPRTYGYFTGDKFSQTIHIKTAKALELLRQSLPKSGNVSPWLKLETVTLTDAMLPDYRHYKLHLKYQIIGFNPGVNNIETSRFALEFKIGNQKIPVIVQPLSLRVGRLALPRVDGLVMAIDVAPPLGPEIISSIWYQRAKWLSFFMAGVMLLWFFYHYFLDFRNAKKPAPFGRAQSRIRKLLSQSADNNINARRILHDAFNQQMGRTLFESELAQFFQAHPQFIAEQQWIQNFFTESKIVFFVNQDASNPGKTVPANAEPQQPGKSTLSPELLIQLATRCSRLEIKSPQ